MGVKQLAATGQTRVRVEADVCIVGAGIAGLVAGVRLARSGKRRVVIVESGVKPDDQTVHALDRIANPSTNYRGDLRARGLGGTSAKWGGKLLPLSPSDVEARPWLGLPAWPLSFGELNRYRAEIEAMMGIDAASYEEDAAMLLDPERLLPRADPAFALRFPKRPSLANHALAHVLRRDLDALENLELWLGATVTSFHFDANARIRKLVARNLAGQALELKARAYLLAAGALESTRLTLLADRASNGAISRMTESLGRHLNDHLGLVVATLRPRDARRTNRMLADRWTLGADRHLHFELRPEVQAAHEIASAYFDIGLDVSDDSGLAQARLALSSARERRLREAVVHGVRALTDLPSLLRTLHWRYGYRQKYWPRDAVAAIKIWAEQLPHDTNRITLSRELDELGQPRIQVTFQRTDAEERTLRTCVAELHAFWRRKVAHTCDLDFEPWVFDPNARLAERAEELAHPAGTTRMGTNRATSVVDPQLRVHAIANLSIASSSVFPSSGSANPVYTIMQLAMRAADAIARGLDGKLVSQSSAGGEPAQPIESPLSAS